MLMEQIYFKGFVSTTFNLLKTMPFTFVAEYKGKFKVFVSNCCLFSLLHISNLLSFRLLGPG